MRHFILSAAMVLSTLSFAQTNEQAKALLEEVKTNLLSFTDQKISFTSIIEIPTQNPDNPKMTRESSGTVTIVGENYKVETNGQTILLNGNRAYVIAPDDREVTVRVLEDEDMAFTPNGVLARFENGSSLAMAGKETIDGKTIQYVKVRPNGSEEIRDIVIGIDMSTKRIYSYTEYGTNDVVTKYIINNYEVNTGVDASEVRFDRSKYEGWRINEPRRRRR
ncbi:LolA family protein [Phaeocystidibacter luteus]|uniref:Outer membrane lipoprotein carrier protein LolA n=1 Tax=Phaeocystidibacter luteus TaxID=911197 RepID=A0A6N6RK88_9FLAO|nr:outer membrane lipoprotein carrier protein LolA [Phaeocystidibacter luteus]KAB2814278.1 outer membrane lipoprotein carrier protein LolA [Phaeocystidibacter luteus]